MTRQDFTRLEEAICHAVTEAIDLIARDRAERFGAGDDLAQGQPTDEPDANGTAWAQIGYWKVRCDELSEALAQVRREAQWQPIATAPKDGTTV